MGLETLTNVPKILQQVRIGIKMCPNTKACPFCMHPASREVKLPKTLDKQKKSSNKAEYVLIKNDDKLVHHRLEGQLHSECFMGLLSDPIYDALVDAGMKAQFRKEGRVVTLPNSPAF